MFGVANQLLAAVALAVGTTLILRRHKRNGQYAEHYGWERPQHCCADGKIAIFGFHFSPSSDPLWILQQTDHLHSHF
jgi:hypothetical protein